MGFSLFKFQKLSAGEKLDFDLRVLSLEPGNDRDQNAGKPAFGCDRQFAAQAAVSSFDLRHHQVEIILGPPGDL